MPYKVSTVITTDKAEATGETRLSIWLRSNGFSFSVDTPDKRLLSFGDALSDATTAKAMAADVSAMVAENGIDVFGTGMMRLVLRSSRAVWIPQHLYNRHEEKRYLDFVSPRNTNTGEEMICRQYVEAIESWAVFGVDAETVNAFKVAMPGIEIANQHIALVGSKLIEESQKHPIMLMHIDDRVGDFEVFFNGGLLLSNSVEADSDGLLYYAINTMKQLHIETPDMELAVCGDVDRSRFAELQRYFPNVTLYTGTPHTCDNPEYYTLHTYRYAILN